MTPRQHLQVPKSYTAQGKVGKVWSQILASIAICLALPVITSSQDVLEREFNPQLKASSRFVKDSDYIYYDLLGKTSKVTTIHNHEKFTSDVKYTKMLSIIVYFSRKKCLQCEHREQILDSVVDKYYKQVEFYRYNCDLDEILAKEDETKTPVDACKNTPLDQLPTVSFRLPEDNVYFPYDPITFQPLSMEGDLTTPEALDTQINHYMPIFAKKIKNIEDNTWFVERFGHLDKVLYFSLDSENTPGYFKGLSAYFKDKLEFAIVSPDAYEVLEYYNITTKPKWVVIKVKNTVFMDVRRYQGELTFSGLRAYLEAIAPKQEINRNDQQDIGKTPLRDQVMKGGMSKLKGAIEFDYDNLLANLDHPDEVVIIHVTDTLSMNYPNLLILQQFYGNLTRVYNFNVNNAAKKRVFRKYFPDEHKPYLLVCPRGNKTYKWKHREVHGAHSTVEELTETISQMIPDTVEKIMSHEMENRVISSLHEGKLALVVFHDQQEVSMGLRKLALLPKYKQHFNFYQMVKPPPERLRELKIKKLSKLVMFLPDLIYLVESEAQVPIDSVHYEAKFIVDPLAEFLNNMIHQHARYLVPPPVVSSELQLLQACDQPLCLLLLLNLKSDIRSESTQDRLNDIAILRKFAGGRAASVILDVGCFVSSIDTFRAKAVGTPSIIVLKRDKKLQDKLAAEAQITPELLYSHYSYSFVRADHKLNPYSSKVFLQGVLEGKLSDHFRPLERVNLGADTCKHSDTDNSKDDTDL